jgi:hypothetical protein
MKKTTIFGVMTLFLLGVVITGAFAMPLGEKNNEMRNALDKGDYESYLNAFDESDRPYLRQKMGEGDFLERSALREERQERMTLVHEAIELGDYTAWVEVIGESPRAEIMLSVITEENFDRFVKMHEAKRSGDFESAREIADELGLESFGKCKHRNIRE